MFNNLTPVVKNLLILNIGIFLLQFFSEGLITSMEVIWLPNMSPVNYPSQGFITDYGMLWNPKFSSFQPYQFFTYMFLHGGLFHIFSNMLWLFFMGSKLEYFMGQKKFISLYIIAGLGAAGFHLLMDYVLQATPLPVLGASGAVAGVMMGAALYFPNDEVIIFPLPIPIKIKYLVIFYTVFEIYNGFNSHDNIAHFAHVGGLVFGFLYIKLFGGKSSGFGY